MDTPLDSASPIARGNCSVAFHSGLSSSEPVTKSSKHRKVASLLEGLKFSFANAFKEQQIDLDKERVSVNEDYMAVPDEKDNDEFQANLGTLRSQIKTYNLETQEAETFLEKGRSTYREGIFKERTLDTKLTKFELCDDDDDIVNIEDRIMLGDPLTTKTDSDKKDSIENNQDMPKRSDSWKSDSLDQKDEGFPGLRKHSSTPSENPDGFSRHHAKASTTMTMTMMSSGNWKKARATFTALKFSLGAEQAVEKRIHHVMKGVQASVQLPTIRRRKWYIHPHNPLKLAWDVIPLLMGLFYSFFAPYRWSQMIPEDGWLLLDLCADVLTLIDIILTFFTRIVKTNTVVENPKHIAIHYLKTYFVLDVFAMLPLYLISTEYYIFKFLRITKLWKSQKLFRKAFFAVHPRGLDVLKVFRAMIIFVIVVNLLVCVWIFLGKEPSLGATWLHNDPSEDGTDAYSLFSVYVRVLLFIAATITTVGYGDIDMRSITEYLVTMLFQLSGTLLVAVLQSQVIYMLHTHTNITNKIREEDLDLERWLAQRERFQYDENEDNYIYTKRLIMSKVSFQTTVKRIHSFYRSNRAFNYKNLTVKTEFFNQLPTKLQDRIIKASFKKFIKNFRIFFQTFNDPSFTRELISHLRLKIFSNHYKIVKEGEQPSGIYFIIRGKILLAYKNMIMLCFGENSFLGDTILVDPNIGFEYIASENLKDEGVKCFYIGKKTFLEICYRYPHVMHSLKKIAYAREDHFEKKCIKMHYDLKKAALHKKMAIGEHPVLDYKEDHHHRDRKISQKFFTLRGSRRNTDSQKSKSIELAIANIKINLIKAEDVEKRLENSESCNYPSIVNSHNSHHNVVPVFEVARRNPLVLDDPVLSSDELRHGHDHDIEDHDQDRGHEEQRREPRTLEDTLDEKLSPRTFGQYFQTLFGNELPMMERSPSRRISSQSQVSQVIEVDGIYKLLHGIEEDMSKEENKVKSYISIDEETARHEDESDTGESELNNSLEVPMDYIEPTFEETDEAEAILEYFYKRIEIIEHKLLRLKKSFREELLEDWKKLKKFKKQVETGVKELDQMDD